MFSIEIINAQTKEVVYEAGRFSTRFSALEAAAKYLLLFVPSHVHLKLAREPYGLSLYRRRDTMEMRPSGRYRMKKVNDDMKRQVIMERKLVSSYEKWYDVKLNGTM
jgi:hypothetical protein